VKVVELLHARFQLKAQRATVRPEFGWILHHLAERPAELGVQFRPVPLEPVLEVLAIHPTLEEPLPTSGARYLLAPSLGEHPIQQDAFVRPATRAANVE